VPGPSSIHPSKPRTSPHTTGSSPSSTATTRR
jgi:hypothetical protein